jgi:hypothetical protein
MLDDAQVERYARHVLLPEVGGRGQARLLAARVAVLGDTAVAQVARDLVTRSGAAATDRVAPSDAIVVAGGRVPDVVPNGRHPIVLVRAAERQATLRLLRGAPCLACADPALLETEPRGLRPGAALSTVTGALAATLVLGALLGRPGGSVVHDVDLDALDLGARSLTGPGCSSCRADA